MTREGDGPGGGADPETGMVQGPGAGRGPFVVLEGADAVGKSTQAEMLTRWLREREAPFRAGREPGGTPLGEAVRALVLEREDLAPSPTSELFLILAARAAFVEEEVEPTLREGRLYLADRFDLSTLAYQGEGHGLDLDRIRSMNALAVGRCRPDLYLVLDLPAEEGEARQADAGVSPDRMESQGSDFLDRVREAYRRLARSEPRAELVDGRGSPEEVHERILSALGRRIGPPFPTGGREPFTSETGYAGNGHGSQWT